MERFCNILSHPHQLAIHRGWGRTLCHKVASSFCGVAQTKRERSRGALDEVFRRGWLSSSKLRLDVGKREGEVAQVLPGRSRSQEGTELAL